MNRGLKLFSSVLFALNVGVVGGGVTSSLADEAGVEVDLGELRGAILSLAAPAGAVATETNPNYKGAAAPAPAAPPSPAAADWPSYNKTLTSERFSDLSQINTKNVGKLKVVCTFDTGRLTSFETGPIMVEGALIGTTDGTAVVWGNTQVTSSTVVWGNLATVSSVGGNSTLANIQQ